MANVLDEFAALSLDEPYGCTYLCGETFASALEWRQHEHRNHSQSELWRCNIPIHTDTAATNTTTQCGRCVYSEPELAAHLTAAHRVADGDVAAWTANGHLWAAGQRNFWCGFCRAIVKLENMGTWAWDERLDHVERHFGNGDSIERGWLKLRG